MVLATLRIQPSPEQRARALEVLCSVRGPTQVHPDCISCRVYNEANADGSVVLLECWASVEAFHEHVRSDLYGRVLAALELSQREPEVCVHHISATEGLPLIQQIRTGAVSAADNSTQT